jgi:hypothetical protein
MRAYPCFYLLPYLFIGIGTTLKFMKLITSISMCRQFSYNLFKALWRYMLLIMIHFLKPLPNVWYFLLNNVNSLFNYWIMHITKYFVLSKYSSIFPKLYILFYFLFFFYFFSNFAGVLNLLNKTAAILRGFLAWYQWYPKPPQLIFGNPLSGSFQNSRKIIRGGCKPPLNGLKPPSKWRVFL